MLLPFQRGGGEKRKRRGCQHLLPTGGAAFTRGGAAGYLMPLVFIPVSPEYRSFLNDNLALDLFEFCRADSGYFHHLFDAFKTSV